MEADFQTPEWVCELMAGLVEGQPGIILEPTPGKGNLVKSLRNKFPSTQVHAPNCNFLQLDPYNVDVVVANPPFSPMRMGYEMLYRFFNFSGYVIALMPWLTIINSENRLEKLKAHGLCKIIHLQRREFKGSRVQTCILILKQGNSGDILFKDVCRGQNND